LIETKSGNNRFLHFKAALHLAALERLYHHWALRKEIGRFIKFGLVGLSGVGVGLGSQWLLTDKLGLFYIASGAIAFVLAATNNFTWNQLWTFNDRAGGRDFTVLLKGWFKFLLSAAAGLGVNLGVQFSLTNYLHIYYVLSALCAIIVATPVNFLSSTWWVWRQASCRAAKEHSPGATD